MGRRGIAVFRRLKGYQRAQFEWFRFFRGCWVRIVNGRASVTAEMALKLADAFRTTPEFWLNAQKAVDPCEASARIRKLPRPLRKVPSLTSVSPRAR